LTFSGAAIVRLDFAGSRAAIATDAIAVIAGLTPFGLHDPISAVRARVDHRIALASISRAGLVFGACIGERNRARQRNVAIEAATAPSPCVITPVATLAPLRDDRSIAASPTWQQNKRAESGDEKRPG
jgi:hypothetical protein